MALGGSQLEWARGVLSDRVEARGYCSSLYKRDTLKFLEETKLAARCCLDLNPCLPCVATCRVGIQLTHTFPLVLQHSAWQCCAQSLGLKRKPPNTVIHTLVKISFLSLVNTHPEHRVCPGEAHTCAVRIHGGGDCTVPSQSRGDLFF